MKLFSDFDVYSRKYTYDEMKVMCCIPYAMQFDSRGLDYEDLMRIVAAVYEHWLTGIDTPSDSEEYTKYPWLEILTNEEEGYIQHYAERVLPEFIKLYLEELKNG